MKNIEIWKDIPDFEGIYQVSSFGNVKSLKYNKEKILKKSKDKNGYFVVGLYNDEVKNKTFKVHQLCAITFLNHLPCGMDLIVDHIDNNNQNNTIENLQIISNRENIVKSIDKKSTSSKYSGVVFHKKSDKWMSKIFINNTYRYLGLFETEIEASKAYQKELSNEKK
jgi:hypothetical protein